MMRLILIISVTGIIVCFSSCDPSYSVILSNKSRIDKRIKVLYTVDFKHFVKDSLSLYDNRIKASKRYLQKPIKTPILNFDTVQRTYSFLLNSNFDVFVEGASLAANPSYGQIFIIDNKDSVTLKKNDKTFRR